MCQSSHGTTVDSKKISLEKHLSGPHGSWEDLTARVQPYSLVRNSGLKEPYTGYNLTMESINTHLFIFPDNFMSKSCMVSEVANSTLESLAKKMDEIVKTISKKYKIHQLLDEKTK